MNTITRNDLEKLNNEITDKFSSDETEIMHYTRNYISNMMWILNILNNQELTKLQYWNIRNYLDWVIELSEFKNIYSKEITIIESELNKYDNPYELSDKIKKNIVNIVLNSK